MSISYLIPVAVLVLVSTMVASSTPTPAPADARHVLVSLDCVTVMVTLLGHEDDVTICPPFALPDPLV